MLHGRDLLKQFWYPVDGTKNSYLLTEFSNSIFIIFFKSILALNLPSGLFWFKNFFCPPDVKRPNFFRDFTHWTSTKAPTWTSFRAYSTSRSQPAFYHIGKLNLCSKTDIHKIAWIYDCTAMSLWWTSLEDICQGILFYSIWWPATCNFIKQDTYLGSHNI